MDDLISRQAAIDAIKKAIWDKQVAKDAIDCVCNVPSAQRWIPASERLPEDERAVLVCLDDGIRTDGHHTSRHGGEWWIGMSKWIYPDELGVVLAWMPMPEPYRKEERDD